MTIPKSRAKVEIQSVVSNSGKSKYLNHQPCGGIATRSMTNRKQTLLAKLKAAVDEDKNVQEFQIEITDSNLIKDDIESVCNKFRESCSWTGREWYWLYETREGKEWNFFYHESHQHSNLSISVSSSMIVDIGTLQKLLGLQNRPLVLINVHLTRRGGKVKVPDGGIAWDAIETPSLCVEVCYGHEKTLNDVLKEAIYDERGVFNDKGLVLLLFRFSKANGIPLIDIEKVELCHVCTHGGTSAINQKMTRELNWLNLNWKFDASVTSNLDFANLPHCCASCTHFGMTYLCSPYFQMD